MTSNATFLLAMSLLLTSESQSQFVDSVTLTLRIQEGIFLDTVLATHIDSALAAAKIETDTLESIHAFPAYIPTILAVKTEAPWSDAWRNGKILTGEPYIDSLSMEYGLQYTDGGDILGWFALFFESPLNMESLSVVYENHPDIIYAEPDHLTCVCDPDDIIYFEKDQRINLAFKSRIDFSSDPSHYWYVSVDPNTEDWSAVIEEDRDANWWQPYIYRWNIPDWYPMTPFETAGAILDSIAMSSDWWVRKHAIEGTWRFFVYSNPWGDPMTLFEHWDSLKTDLLASQPEVVDALQQALLDPDPDVSASAELAINQITPYLSVNPGQENPSMYKLFQNYPNPFNPRTSINFSLPRTSNVSLKIFNLLGEEVATLASGQMGAGNHAVKWDATGAPSGVYFYRLQARHADGGQAGDFVETKKLLLLK